MTKSKNDPAAGHREHLSELRRRVRTIGGAKVHQALKEAFSNTPPEHPLLNALHLALASQIWIEHLAARNPALADGALRQQLGRECALEDFQHLLLQFHDEIRDAK